MEDKKLAWCMFYSAVMGWQHHPGRKEPLTSTQAAVIADEMLDNYNRRLVIWDGYKPQER